MNRRDVFKQTASSLGALTIGLPLASFAQAAAQPKAKEARFGKLAETSSQCISTGLTCIKHCQMELLQGNKIMAECLQSVLELVTTCESLEKLALYDSTYTKDFAKLTAKVCSDCAKICEKHASHMEACKNCMDACKACEKACLAA
jgi:Cys-rich four helix bundle protein (predicted Tat secretion target)